MKKLSFFLMAMLMSVMSFAAEATATISFADKAQRTVYTTSQQVWEQNGIVVTNDKASSTSNVGDYANPARFYKSSKVTIQCTLGNIKKIEISGCGANDKTTPWNTNGDAVVNGTSATITPTSTSDTYTIATLNGQARAGQMVVTYEVSDEGFVATPAIEGEQYFKESATVSMKAAEGLKVYYTLDGTEPTTASTEYAAPFEVTETTTVKAIAHDGENASEVVTVVFKKMQVLTCAEAAAITPNGDKYIVRGYVTSASAYNTQYNNIDFFVADTKDGGEVLKVFRAVAASEADKAVKEGDYVEVIGELAAYQEKIQIGQGGIYTIIPEPAPEPTTEIVYFIDVKKWGKVNAYAWNAGGNNGWPGKAATKEAEQIAGYDVYSFTADAGEYDNVIFNNKVGDTGSQTGDLEWTAGKYYVMDLGWLTKEEAEAKLAAPLPEVWNIVGDAGLMGKGWDLNAAENAMTKQEDGTYKLEKKDITITAGAYEYKAAKDHSYDVAIPQSGNQKLTISKSGIYDITFVLDVTAKKLTATATLKKEAVVIPTVVIAGDMNSWNQTKDKFTMAADSLTATLKTTLTVKNYGFKMIVGGAWHSDGKTITRAANSTKFTGANSNTNSTLKADIAGEYLFTWEYATKTLTVTYPELPVEYTVTATVNPAETGTVAGAGKYEEGKEATLTATPAEGYEFVNWTVGDSIVSTENPYKFTITADLALVANFKEVVKAIEVNVTGATSTSGEWSIDLAGSWNDQALTIRLWQDNTQGFGTYAANAETGYSAQLGVKELTPTTAGVYADNGDGTFTFTATATDAEGAIYNITLTGANPAVEPEEPEAQYVDFYATAEFSDNIWAEAEDGTALDLYFAEDQPYNGEGTYTVTAIYSDAEWTEYNVAGSVTVEYDDVEGTEVLMGDLSTTDGSLNVHVVITKAGSGSVEGTPMEVNVTNLEVNYATTAFTGTDEYGMFTVSLVPNTNKPIEGKPMTFELDLENSSILYSMGWVSSPLTLVSGEITIDMNAPSATAIVTASLEDQTFVLTINMTATASESVDINLEATSAVVDEDVLTLYATYEDEEGNTFPVAVELQGFENVEGLKEYEAEEICKITIGDPNSEVETEFMDIAYANSVAVIIGEEGENSISLEGDFSSWATGSNYYVTITGSLNGKQDPGTGLDNVQVEVKTVKMIKNGQLIINKGGREFNAQGATLK